MAFFRWVQPSSRELILIPTIRWLIIARFFSDLIFYSSTLVLFQQQRGLNLFEMFLMESILSTSIWLADIPTSICAERIGYQRVMIIGRAVGFLGMVCFVLAHGFWMFALAEVLGGFAIACTSGCEHALIYNSLSTDVRDRLGIAAFSLLNSASSAGFFVGLFTGSFLGAYSPVLAATVSVIPAFGTLCATYPLLRSVPASAGIQQKGRELMHLKTILGTTRRTLQIRPTLVWLSIASSLAFALAHSIFWYNQLYFQQAGIPVAVFGPITALAVALQVLLQLYLPAIQRVIGTRLALFISCILPGMAYICLAITHASLLTTLLVIGVIIFSAWQQPIADHELNRHLPDALRATTLSVLALSGSLAKSILDPLIGHLGDRGLDITGLGLGLALLLLGILSPFLLSNTVPPSKETSSDNT